MKIKFGGWDDYRKKLSDYPKFNFIKMVIILQLTGGSHTHTSLTEGQEYVPAKRTREAPTLEITVRYNYLPSGMEQLRKDSNRLQL